MSLVSVVAHLAGQMLRHSGTADINGGVNIGQVTVSQALHVLNDGVAIAAHQCYSASPPDLYHS